MRQHGIVHPQMMDALAPNFYPSLCTLAEHSVDAYGHPSAALMPLGGLEGLPCRIAPLASGELRSAQQIYATATHQVALGGYYPTILTTYAAQVDGVTYDIEGVEHDGNANATRLFVRRVT